MYSTPLTAVAFFISFEKKLGKCLALSQKLHTFANAITKVMHFGSLAQLNRASDYGSEGYRFESYPGHFLRIFLLNITMDAFGCDNRGLHFLYPAL